MVIMYLTQLAQSTITLYEHRTHYPAYGLQAEYRRLLGPLQRLTDYGQQYAVLVLLYRLETLSRITVPLAVPSDCTVKPSALVCGSSASFMLPLSEHQGIR